MPPNRPPHSNGPSWWLIALIVIALIAALAAWRAGLFGNDNEMIPSHSGSPPTGTPPAAVAPPPASEPAAVEGPIQQAAPEQAEAKPTGPRYPVPELDAAARRAAPLPDPADSDRPIERALQTLAPRPTLARFLNLQEIARRLVITVDNLPRTVVPSQHSAIQRIPGQMAVAPSGDGFELLPANAERYQPFVRFVESIDLKSMVALYVRFYPLLQHEYQQIGFPDGHFNDRVVAAIDDMISAPTPAGPIRLVQPKVLYRFADPDLESLSAGRKIMIRIGPDNAKRLRAVLVRLRRELTTFAH